MVSNIKAYFLVALLLFMLLSAAFASGQVTGPDKTKPLSNIQEVREYLLKESHTGNQTLFDSLLISYALFNKDNCLIEKTQYDKKGMLALRATSKYNDKCNPTEQVQYDGHGAIKMKKTFKYDSRDSITEETLFENANDIESRKEYIYGERGRKILMKEVNEEGETLKKSEYEYDDLGNIIEEREYDRHDSLTLRYHYQCDAAKNRVEEIRYNGKTEQWRFKYIYTSFNKPAKEEHFYAYETSNSSEVYTYDKDQHLVEDVIYDYKNKVMQKKNYTYKAGKLILSDENNLITKYEYDSLGNITVEKISSGNDMLSEKTFDKHGNVISLAHYSSGIISFTEINKYDGAEPERLIKESLVDKYKKLISEAEFKYDDKGNLIDTIDRNGDSKVISRKIVVYKYY